MRSKKCLGFFLLLGLSVLSLLTSLDVNALSHDVKYLPLTSDSSWSGGYTGLLPENLPFSVRWFEPNQPNFSNLKLNSNHYFLSTYSEEQNECVLGSNVLVGNPWRSMPIWQNSNEFYYSIPSYSFLYDATSSNSYAGHYNDAVCQQSISFGDYLPFSNIPFHYNMDWSSLVNINLFDRGPYLDLEPYYYAFDSAYFHDSFTSPDGLQFSNNLRLSEVIGVAPNKFYDMTIPLGQLDERVAGPMVEGRHVTIKSVFSNYNSVDGSFSTIDNQAPYLNFTPGSGVQLVYTGRFISSDTTPSVSSGYANCSSVTHSIAFENYLDLEIICEWDSPVTYDDSQLYFALQFVTGQGQDFVFDTNIDLAYSSTFIITDYDDTPGGTWGYEPTGNHLTDAPGSAEGLYIRQQEDKGIIIDGVNFSESLLRLFGFAFINPFAPLFNLFTNQNQCANIPTIASMIHSEETYVCPYFDITTRNIVTPVLSIASVMLVFGFAVRWLGARSGNMFEDSVDTDSYKFANKFRRK